MYADLDDRWSNNIIYYRFFYINLRNNIWFMGIILRNMPNAIMNSENIRTYIYIAIYNNYTQAQINLDFD